MIPEAREVHLSREDRKVVEACCRSPVTLQRDLKRARIVLLAAAGRRARSIAKEVGVQPRIVSLWRHRYADHGLEGLQDKPRPRKQPIYTKATDRPPPAGFARWTGPLLAGALAVYTWPRDPDPLKLIQPASRTPRAQIYDRRVPAFRIVEALNIIEDVGLGIVPRSIHFARSPLGLQ